MSIIDSVMACQGHTCPTLKFALYFFYVLSLVLILSLANETTGYSGSTASSFRRRDHWENNKGRSPLMQLETVVPRAFFFSSSQTNRETMRFTGKGVKVAILDTGLHEHFSEYSHNHVRCTSVVPDVSCGDAGFQHGTLSTSVLGGNVHSRYCSSRSAHEVWDDSTASISNPTRPQIPEQPEGLPDASEAPSGSASPSTPAQAEKVPSEPQGVEEEVKEEVRKKWLCRPSYYGMAPEADILVIRVFDRDRESSPEYVAKALERAEEWGAKVINLSFSSEDYWEGHISIRVQRLISKGVIIVAAAGNEGPEFGTVTHPADMPGVLSVGATKVWCPSRSSPQNTCSLQRGHPSFFSTCCRQVVSTFSSRGPTTWELPFGAGRTKPDLVAVGENVLGVEAISPLIRSWTKGETFGTSIAAPIVSGAVAVCVEALMDAGTPLHQITTTTIKSLLLSTATPLHPSAEEQVRETALWQEWTAEANATKVFSGIPTRRTYEHYAMALRYSRYSQGHGALNVTQALAVIAGRAVTRQKTSPPNPRLSIDAARLSVVVSPPGVFASATTIKGSEVVDTSVGSKNRIHSTMMHNNATDLNRLRRPGWLEWPVNEQPLYPNGPPHVVNLTICAGDRELHRVKEALSSSMELKKEIVCENTDESIADESMNFTSEDLSFFVIQTDLETHVEDRFCGTLTVMAWIHPDFLDFMMPHIHRCRQMRLEGGIHLRLSGDMYVTSIPLLYDITFPPPRSARLLWDTAHQWMNPTGLSPPPPPPPPKDSSDEGSDVFSTTGAPVSPPPIWVPGDDPHCPPRVSLEDRVWNAPSREGNRETGEPAGGDHPHANGALLYLYLRRELALTIDFFPLLPLALGGTRNDKQRHNESGMEHHSVSSNRQAADDPHTNTPHLWWWRRAFQENSMYLLLDPELPLTRTFRKELSEAVRRYGLNVVIFAEWHNATVANQLQREGEEIKTENPSDHDAEGGPDPITNNTPTTVSAVLQGAAHVPSVNQWLVDVAHYAGLRSTLQFSDTILDGILALPKNPDFVNEPTLSSIIPIRVVGRLRGASSVYIREISNKTENDVPAQVAYTNSYRTCTEGSTKGCDRERTAVVACSLPGAEHYRSLRKKPIVLHDESGVQRQFFEDEWESSAEFFGRSSSGTGRSDETHSAMWRTFGVLRVPLSAVSSKADASFSSSKIRGKSGITSRRNNLSPKATNSGWVNTAQVVVFSDSNCLSASDGRIRGTVRRVLSAFHDHLLQNGVADNENVVDEDQGVLYSEEEGGFLKDIERQEGESNTICLELVKEMLYTASTGNVEWMCGSIDSSRNTPSRIERHPLLSLDEFLNPTVVSSISENNTHTDFLTVTPDEDEMYLLEKLVLDATPYRRDVGRVLQGLLFTVAPHHPTQRRDRREQVENAGDKHEITESVNQRLSISYSLYKDSSSQKNYASSKVDLGRVVDYIPFLILLIIAIAFSAWSFRSKASHKCSMKERNLKSA